MVKVRVMGHHRVQQSLLDLFSVSVFQTRPTELPVDPATLLTAAARLGVDGLLATLVTGSALEKHLHSQSSSTCSDPVTESDLKEVSGVTSQSTENSTPQLELKTSSIHEVRFLKETLHCLH